MAAALEEHVELQYLNPEYLSEFRQANAICWFQTAIVALMLSPALREYMWCKVFSFTESTIEGKRILIPISVNYSSVSVDDFNRVIRDSNLFIDTNGNNIVVNDNELHDIKYHIFIVLEMLRRRIVNLLKHQVTGDSKFYDKESMMKDDTIKSIFHHAPALIRLGILGNKCGGGDSMRFIYILLALYDNLYCVYIENENTGFDRDYYKKNDFSSIIFKNNGNGVLGHYITIFSDKKNRVTYRYDNDRYDSIYIKSKPITDYEGDVDLDSDDIENIDSILDYIRSNPHSQVLSLRDDDKFVCHNTMNLFGTSVNMSVPMIMFTDAPNKFSLDQLKILFPEDFVNVGAGAAGAVAGGKRRKRSRRNKNNKSIKTRSKKSSRRVLRKSKTIKRRNNKKPMRKTKR